MTGGEPGFTTVTLAQCPIDLLEQSRRHNESLMREFAFIAESDDDGTSAPTRLLALVERLRGRLPELGSQVELQVEAAHARGDDTIDLVVVVPAGGRTIAIKFSRAFDEAEEFCRSGDLLTPAETDETGRFRTWYLEQYVQQLDGEPAVSWPQWRARGAPRPRV